MKGGRTIYKSETKKWEPVDLNIKPKDNHYANDESTFLNILEVEPDLSKDSNPAHTGNFFLYPNQKIFRNKRDKKPISLAAAFDKLGPKGIDDRDVIKHLEDAINKRVIEDIRLGDPKHRGFTKILKNAFNELTKHMRHLKRAYIINALPSRVDSSSRTPPGLPPLSRSLPRRPLPPISRKRIRSPSSPSRKRFARGKTNKNIKKSKKKYRRYKKICKRTHKR